MRLPAVVLLAWLLAGCGATSLARIQTTYNDLMQQHAQLNDKSAPRPPSFGNGVDLTMHDLELAFLTLAQEAQVSAEDADDPRTRVALLRTAGLAAWQAGEQGLEEALKVQSKGTQACDALAADVKRFGAPRDCALLRGIGALADGSQIGREVRRVLGMRDGDGDLPATETDTVKGLLARSAAAAARLGTVHSQAKADTGLDASVTGYLERQVFLAHCNQLGVLRLARALDSRPLRDEALGNYCRTRGVLVGSASLRGGCPGDSKPAAETCP